MRKAIAWFAENPVAANLLMVLILAAGIAGLPSIKQQTFPDLDVDLIQIGVPYLGASPSEVEEGVCIRIEEELQGVDGIDQMTSSSAEMPEIAEKPGRCCMPGCPCGRPLRSPRLSTWSCSSWRTVRPITSSAA